MLDVVFPSSVLLCHFIFCFLCMSVCSSIFWFVYYYIIFIMCWCHQHCCFLLMGLCLTCLGSVYDSTCYLSSFFPLPSSFILLPSVVLFAFYPFLHLFLLPVPVVVLLLVSVTVATSPLPVLLTTSTFTLSLLLYPRILPGQLFPLLSRMPLSSLPYGFSP